MVGTPPRLCNLLWAKIGPHRGRGANYPFVDFGVKANAAAALIVLSHAGNFLPVGSIGKSDGGEEFVVGYDGQAFLTQLAPHNTVTITTSAGQCTAAFDYAPSPDEQVLISPSVTCPLDAGGAQQIPLRGSI